MSIMRYGQVAVLTALMGAPMLAIGIVPTMAVPVPSAWVDTEASTNVAFDAGRPHGRVFRLALELDAMPSNNVMVAFGTDANGNGVLDRAEADLLVGWDSGEWFWRDRRGGGGQSAARAAGHRRLDWEVLLTPKKAPVEIVARDADGVVFTGVPTPALFDDAWNLMRVTARGLAGVNGLLAAEVKGGFMVYVK